MWRIILYSQWKWSRAWLLPVTVVGFAIPYFMLRVGYESERYWDAAGLLEQVAMWGKAYPALAAGLGLLVGATAWIHDHRGSHVYALVLPTPRWYYVLLRYSAGLVLLLPVIVAVLLGTVSATMFTTLPPGIYAYPVQLTARFVLAALLAYSLFFTIASGTQKAAGIVLGLVGIVVTSQLLAGIAGADLNVLESTFDRITIWPGPLEVFVGRWMLVDL